MRRFWLPLAASLILGLPAFATPLFTVSGTNGDGNPVAAQAAFTFASGSLTAQLTNLQPNPSDAGQLLTGISFTFASGAFANNVGSLANLTGVTRDITSSTAWTDVIINTGSTHWNVSNTGAAFSLFFQGPDYAVIGVPGPGPKYSANASIVGNGPHNPFLAGSPIFTINIPGLTAASDISGVTFFFGTDRQYSQVGVPCSDCDGGGGGGQDFAPEPVSFLLAGSGLVGIYFLRLRRRSST